MKRNVLIIILICSFFISCKSQKNEEKEVVEETVSDPLPEKVIEKKKSDITITPIQHATLILEWKGKTIYIDPTGGAKAFAGKKTADLVLITDIHGDHMNIDTLDSLDLAKSQIIVPQAVAEKLPANYTEQLVIINNGETKM